MTKARDLADIISGGFTADDIPNLDASKITSGELPNARVADLPTSKITTGTFADARVSASSVNQHATDYDDNALKSNVALLGFKTASNGSLTKFNLQDQVVDEFVDNSGIDTGNSTNASIDSGEVSSGTSGNYFGDGSDGDVTISSSTNLTVSNTSGSYDGDMVLKQYNTLTVNAGQTLSTNVPCRGLFIYVKGNCTINGTIDMTGRGAYADPASTSSPSWGSAGSDGNTLGANGLQLGMVKAGSSETLINNGTGFNGCGTAVRTAVANQADISGNGKIYSISRYGAAGGSGSHGNNHAEGNAGTSGAGSNQTGGGGSGATSNSSQSNAGNGAAGSCWSGGSGGAGVHGGFDSNAHAQPNGGAAGTGNFGGNAGGAGNPGGIGNGGHGGTGQTGTGGTVWLIVGGTLSGSGSIVSNGKNGGAFVNNSCGGGGGSGGGAIIVAAVTDSSSLTLTANGGSGTITSNSGGSKHGGNGGAGYTLKEGGLSVAGTVETTATILSTATTAQAVPTKSDLVLLMKNHSGTATLNTDIKGYISRDGGTTYTQGTLVDKGNYGTGKILAVHDLDISSQPSGSSMKYKIELANQAAGSKETRIQACSLGWR